jgi:hypothetical protein
VPGFLAGFAAVLTLIYILALHFDATALPTTRLGILSVAGLGVAVLLAPFFRSVASATWRRGAVMVFDPAQWLSASFIAWPKW